VEKSLERHAMPFHGVKNKNEKRLKTNYETGQPETRNLPPDLHKKRTHTKVVAYQKNAKKERKRGFDGSEGGTLNDQPHLPGVVKLGKQKVGGL